MLEESTGVPGADRRQRQTDRLDQGFFRPGFRALRTSLLIFEKASSIGLFYGPESRMAGRAAGNLAARSTLLPSVPCGRSGCPSQPPDPYAAQEPENLLYVSFEDHRSGRALHGKRWSHPFYAHAREHCGVSSPVARYRAMCPLTLLGPGVQRRQRDVRAHLIDEH